MNGKTPVSVLIEFCIQHKVAPPQYEHVNPTNNNPILFEYFVRAFEFMAKGSGKSKSEAKHAASQALLELLAQMEPYKNKLVPLNSSPPKKENRSSFQNNDAIGALITLCLQRQLQSPCFDEVSIRVEDHKPQFTFACRLGSNHTSGTAMTKKGAKQKAASEMLKFIEGIAAQDSSDCSSMSSDGPVKTVIPLLEVPSIEEVLAEYRQRKKPYIQPVKGGLRNRRNFFLKLPIEKRRKAGEILMNRTGYLPSSEIVSEAFKAMGIDYEVKDMDKPRNIKRFSTLESNFDCVIIAQSDELYEMVIDYLKTMLNLQNTAKFPLGDVTNDLHVI